VPHNIVLFASFFVSQIAKQPLLHNCNRGCFVTNHLEVLSIVQDEIVVKQANFPKMAMVMFKKKFIKF
jgi:hypothetical protein